MSKWAAFLASLATRGGAIFILVILTLLILVGALLLYLRHDISGAQFGEVIGASGVYTTLIAVLKTDAVTKGE